MTGVPDRWSCERCGWTITVGSLPWPRHLDFLREEALRHGRRHAVNLTALARAFGLEEE